MNGGADINYKEAIGMVHVDFECFNKGMKLGDPRSITKLGYMYE